MSRTATVTWSHRNGAVLSISRLERSPQQAHRVAETVEALVHRQLSLGQRPEVTESLGVDQRVEPCNRGAEASLDGRHQGPAIGKIARLEQPLVAHEHERLGKLFS